MLKVELQFGSDWITLTRADGNVCSIESSLHDKDVPECKEWNTEVDALESLILAQFSAGIDVQSEVYKNSLNDAVLAICNHIYGQ